MLVWNIRAPIRTRMLNYLLEKKQNVKIIKAFIDAYLKKKIKTGKQTSRPWILLRATSPGISAKF